MWNFREFKIEKGLEIKIFLNSTFLLFSFFYLIYPFQKKQCLFLFVCF